jgi:hypothetical protein
MNNDNELRVEGIREVLRSKGEGREQNAEVK